jgi:maleylacetoacetate isomerase
MKLFGYFRSSASYRVRISLNLKGLSYEQVAVNLKKGDQLNETYRALNPQGLVPALADGDLLLTQSLAIMAWLDDVYPERPLVMGSPDERAKIRAIASIIACDTQPLQNLRVLKYLSNELGITEAQKLQWIRHWICEGLMAVESKLDGEDFCLGSTPTLADVCLVPQVYNAQRFDIDTGSYPKLTRVVKNCFELDAFCSARPEAQTDFIAD